MTKAGTLEKYIRAEDFFTNSKPNTTAEDVKREMMASYNGPITTSQAYRNAGIDTEAWNQLGYRIIGAERH